MRSFNEYLSTKRHQHGDKFDPSDLHEQFIEHWRTGDRVEIEMKGEGKMRGRIGVTTGWKPCFILLLRSNSSGSSWTLRKEDKVIRVISK